MKKALPTIGALLIIAVFTLLFMFLPKVAIATTAAVLLLASVGLYLAMKATPLAATWYADEPTIKLLASLSLVDVTTGMLTPKRINVLAKTVDYTVLGTEPCGTVFTTRGAAGAVNFTLPVVSPALKGVWYRFKNVVDQVMTVTSNPADTLVVDGDLTADSLAASTASHKIGAEIEAFCDGTSWFASGVNVGVTYTVAT